MEKITEKRLKSSYLLTIKLINNYCAGYLKQVMNDMAPFHETAKQKWKRLNRIERRERKNINAKVS